MVTFSSELKLPVEYKSGDNEIDPVPFSLHTPPVELVSKDLVEPSQIAKVDVVLVAYGGLLSIALPLNVTTSAVAPSEEHVISQLIPLTSLLSPLLLFILA